ncbi:YceI family protein [Luteolibacter flavescens]|uniref:YceI family protein n=1 Tax=Luteolibacter flavescens TaxID=1859460 RepID=A0ABT3FMQ1_9BACT|nr:YceI family protein [Luteolibacter flavescens]MCW1884850.1 YceI family protein [Luteolibacter flavescens]
MKTNILTVPAAIFALTLVSCENPADKTEAAAVKDAVEKTETTTDTAAGTKYVFTPESKVEFTGSKVTGKHDGGFKTFTGHFTVKDGKPVGNDHKVVIDMNSTWSDSDKLTEHLKAPDFFDVEKFPQTTFDVTELTAGENGAYTVAGNFTLHGVTKNITFPATVTESGDTVTIKAEFDIKRKDFGIVYPGKAEDLIRDEVVIRLDLTAKPGA